MSEIRADKVSPRTGTYISLNTVDQKNLIINGGMDIAQRGTSQASITAAGYYTIDRWRTDIVTAGTWTQTQSTEVPTGQGFFNSTKFDCTTADGSLAAGDRVFYSQRIEDQNCTYLKKGTSSAESTTVSFWVKSNKTGTYICELFDSQNSRHINKSYTISSADTWEKKTITFAGDTTGAFANDNGIGLMLQFWLAAGSTYTSGTLQTSWGSTTNANRAVGQVNLADSTSNEWYITGVQLEAGQTASEFEFLPHDVNLQRCQRYYQILNNGVNQSWGMAFNYTSNQVRGSQVLNTVMRSTPSIDQVTGTDRYGFFRNGAGDYFSGLSGLDSKTTNRYIEWNVLSNVSGTVGQAGMLRTNHNDSFMGLDSEL
jgi:hypothetical protein